MKKYELEKFTTPSEISRARSLERPKILRLKNVLQNLSALSQVLSILDSSKFKPEQQITARTMVNIR